MATRPCLRCSKLIPETAAFCRRCGHRLIEKTNTAPREQARATRAPATTRAAVVEALPLRPPSPEPCVVGRPGFFVAAMAVAAGVLVQFMASLPPPPAIPSDPGPPAVVDVDSDAGARQLARMRERVAATRERLGAARERLATARQELDWNLAREARSFSPKHLSAAPRDFPAPAAPLWRRAQDGVPASPPSMLPGGWPRHPQSIDDVARDNVLREGAPRITGYSRASGAAGSRIEIDGRGLGQTSRVLFAAPATRGNAWRDADFRVRDDGRLIVTVPDLGPSPRPATVLVITPRGAAVTVSHDSTLVSVDPVTSSTAGAGGLYVVTAGASLTPGRGSVVVVDRGATVRSPAASLLLVRAGGGVERARADCLIVRETPRPEVRDLSAVPVLDVPALNTCFLESAFQYTGR